MYRKIRKQAVFYLYNKIWLLKNDKCGNVRNPDQNHGSKRISE